MLKQITNEQILELAAEHFSNTLETWLTPSSNEEIIEFAKALLKKVEKQNG